MYSNQPHSQTIVSYLAEDSSFVPNQEFHDVVSAIKKCFIMSQLPQNLAPFVMKATVIIYSSLWKIEYILGP